MEDDLNNIFFKLKTNQSTKINLIGCDTIVNSPSFILYVNMGSQFYIYEHRYKLSRVGAAAAYAGAAAAYAGQAKIKPN